MLDWYICELAALLATGVQWGDSCSAAAGLSPPFGWTV